MATTKFRSVKPSRNGNYFILNTSQGEIFLTDKQYAGMKPGTDEVEYEIKTGYTKADGSTVAFDKPRLEFSGFVAPSRIDLMRERAQVASEFGLVGVTL